MNTTSGYSSVAVLVVQGVGGGVAGAGGQGVVRININIHVGCGQRLCSGEASSRNALLNCLNM